MWRLVAIAVLLLSIAGCDLMGPDSRRLMILDHMVECTGMGPQLCMLAHEPGATELSRIYSGIEGFVYEWGYVHEIDVRDYTVRNPPADDSSIRTALRRSVARERVPAGTEFDIFLTGGSYALREIEPDTYRAYDSVNLACGGDVDCAGLSAAVVAESRIGLRLRHPASADLPLDVVAWEVCDGQMLGSTRCTS